MQQLIIQVALRITIGEKKNLILTINF